MEFRALGSVQVDDPGREEARQVATQPKRMALLAYLTLARPHGPKRRDTLLALLWPEASQERGRQVLRQTLHLMRQSLGPDVLVSRGDDDIEIDQSRVSCDAIRFERAIEDGQLAEALDLYRGDFLHGFHVADVSQDFEEWIAEERRRLRAMAGTAAWSLAANEEKAGNQAGAIYWARRAAQLDRDNEDAILGLMHLHARLGDRVGALRVFDEHAQRLQRDYGAEPRDDLAKLSESLRAAPAPAVRAPAGAADSPANERTEAPRHRVPVAPTPHGQWRWVAAALAVALIAVGAMWLGSRAGGPGRGALLAVGSIVEFTSPDSSAESAVAADLLATSLARLRGIEVIPEVRLYDIQAQLKAVGASPGLLSAARQAGASRILRGTLRRLGDRRLSFDGQVIDLSTGSVVHAFRAEGVDLFDVVDRATQSVALRLGAQAPAASIADVTTRSLVAYRIYQEALRAFYSSDARSAQALFRAAEAEDTTFAMAAYYDGVVATIMNQPAGAILDRAARLAEHAPDRERLLIRYRVAALHQSADAEPLAETLSVRYPSDLDAVAASAALRQRAGAWGEAAALYRSVIRRDSLSLHAATARCLACEAYVDLWWTYVYADSMGAAEAAMREWAARQGPAAPINELLTIVLERQGRFEDARSRLEGEAPPDGSLRRAMLAIRQSELDAARDTLDALRRSAPPALRGDVAWWTSVVLRNQGRPEAALAVPGIESTVRMVSGLEAGRYRDAAAIADAGRRDVQRQDPHGWPRRLTWVLVHAATALAAARDTSRLQAMADSAQRIGAGSYFGRDPRLHHYIRGLLWLARGDTARAAESFRSSIWSFTDGYTRANYELARALIALGRPREAIYPLQAALRGDLQSSNFYVTRTELHEQLARAFAAVGERDSARAEYAMVARAWARAEPAFVTRRAVAEAYLAQR